MNRRDFMKRLTGTLAVATVATGIGLLLDGKLQA